MKRQETGIKMDSKTQTKRDMKRYTERWLDKTERQEMGRETRDKQREEVARDGQRDKRQTE
jgi:hypothetical protein